MDRLKAFLSTRRFETVITVLIVVNAITLGLETVPAIMERFGPVLVLIDRAILAVFVVELLARLVAWRLEFFRDPWRIFDLIVVGVALMPATGNLSVLRALRILRVLRLISMVPLMDVASSASCKLLVLRPRELDAVPLGLPIRWIAIEECPGSVVTPDALCPRQPLDRCPSHSQVGGAQLLFDA